MEIIIRDVEWKLRFENKWQPPRGRRLSTNSPAPCPVAGVKRRAISWYQSRTNHRRFLPFPTRREKGRGRGQFVIVSKFISHSLISLRFAPPPSFTESPALGLMTSEHSDVTTPSLQQSFVFLDAVIASASIQESSKHPKPRINFPPTEWN